MKGVLYHCHTLEDVEQAAFMLLLHGYQFCSTANWSLTVEDHQSHFLSGLHILMGDNAKNLILSGEEEDKDYYLNEGYQEKYL